MITKRHGTLGGTTVSGWYQVRLRLMPASCRRGISESVSGWAMAWVGISTIALAGPSIRAGRGGHQPVEADEHRVGGRPHVGQALQALHRLGDRGRMHDQPVGGDLVLFVDDRLAGDQDGVAHGLGFRGRDSGGVGSFEKLKASAKKASAAGSAR
jgi:hypothetical protein